MAGEDEGFLHRWDRLKREAREEEPREAAPDSSAAPQPDAEAEEIDPATLPPIDSLGPASDYTVFLRRGVPAALRRAALRKAWASDPAIADHRPMVEYAWDCNAPGYGQLRPTDDPAGFAKALLGRALGNRAPSGTLATPDGPEPASVDESRPLAEPEKIVSDAEGRQRPLSSPEGETAGEATDTADATPSHRAEG